MDINAPAVLSANAILTAAQQKLETLNADDPMYNTLAMLIDLNGAMHNDIVEMRDQIANIGQQVNAYVETGYGAQALKDAFDMIHTSLDDNGASTLCLSLTYRKGGEEIMYYLDNQGSIHAGQWDIDEGSATPLPFIVPGNIIEEDAIENYPMLVSWSSTDDCETRGLPVLQQGRNGWKLIRIRFTEQGSYAKIVSTVWDGSV